MASLADGAERRAIFATERGAVPRIPTTGALLKNASPSPLGVPKLTAPKTNSMIFGGQFRRIGR